ncbi:Novel Xylose regulator from LacI family [hydrothermal vent metagenome]|uniref:Novel Xylose regulator from LacI family n=1 Tax=hydrothermal vent metagenome TaxID=652676 RepID=A0A3B1C6B3_9ZZZZ
MNGVAIMAPETPQVRDAIAKLKASNIAVVSMISDQPMRSAMRVLRAKCDGMQINYSQEKIRIEIVLRENLP